jgi:hypothetical protein
MKMAALTVKARGRDIVVTEPGTGLSVTYRRVPDVPTLVALRPLPSGPDARTAKFLADAWEAAYGKAKDLDWL